jgi:hypothetical protein
MRRLHSSMGTLDRGPVGHEEPRFPPARAFRQEPGGKGDDVGEEVPVKQAEKEGVAGPVGEPLGHHAGGPGLRHIPGRAAGVGGEQDQAGGREPEEYGANGNADAAHPCHPEGAQRPKDLARRHSSRARARSFASLRMAASEPKLPRLRRLPRFHFDRPDRPHDIALEILRHDHVGCGPEE